MLISVPFLLTTFAVYAYFKDLHERTIGKNIMAYVLCLATGYTLYGCLQLIYNEIHIPDNWCRVIAFTTYISLLSNFLWLGTISFEIWWTFG